VRDQLSRWISDPDQDHGVRVMGLDGRWTYTPYAELAGLAAASAEICADSSKGGPATVAVCCEDPRMFIAALFGALLAGARVSCQPPPGVFGSPAAHAEMVGVRLRSLQPDLLLSDGLAEPTLQAVLSTRTRHVTVPRRPAQTVPRATSSDGGIIQFTSGSTAAGKAVVVGKAALEANIAAIVEWLGLGPGDGTSSWLPFHHDMGLVGCLLTPVTNQRPVWFMSPQQFVRRPEAWLRTFAEGATTSAAPPFGYEHCTRKVPPGTDLDLSRWRVAIIGAERVRQQTLRDFASRFSPDGFDADAFRPGYGLAEATLAVTGRRPAEPVRALDVEASSLREGAAVRLSAARTPEHERVLVSGCGRPLTGCAVEVRDPDGTLLGPGRVGEIVVRSPALGRYLGTGPAATGPAATGPTAAEGTRFSDGKLWTNDLGFIDNGELFCVGRVGDAIKVRGRFICAEMVESAAADKLGLPSGTAVALLGMRGSHAHMALLLDDRAAVLAEDAYRAAKAVTNGAEVKISVLACPRRVVQRTSSGKPKRRAMWHALNAGALDQYSVAVPGTAAWAEHE
jgi:acyl-CoA synthetase (AMP-forming)/AMP-acid ligase II